VAGAACLRNESQCVVSLLWRRAACGMNPETHLLASWVIGAKTTDNARDCRLVALAGILPDADGLGLLADAANRAFGGPRTLCYEHYHHYLLHAAGGFQGPGLALAHRPGMLDRGGEEKVSTLMRNRAFKNMLSRKQE